MSAHLNRAQMLLSQERYELAEKELRAALIENPDDSGVLSMLAVCLCEQKKYEEATSAAEQAIASRPDDDFAFYALAIVMYQRNRFAESREAINQAIALDPYDPHHHAHVAALEIQANNYQACLDASDRGLACDPENQRCTNLRAVALTKLGRREEAAAAMETALDLNPENAATHANKGWAALHDREPKEAMEHFREALRLEPDLDWARAGIVEAMKARNPIYRWLLAWFLWLSGLSPRVQMGLVIGIVIGQSVLVSLTQSVPALAPIAPFLIYGYLGFVWMTWVSSRLFNVVLMFNKFGRLVLSDRERRESLIVACYLALGLGVVLVDAIFFGFVGLFFLGFPFLAALIPLNGAFSCKASGPRWIMVAITVAVTAMALVALYGVWAWNNVDGGADDVMKWMRYSIRGSLYSTWATVFLIGWNKPKKL